MKITHENVRKRRLIWIITLIMMTDGVGNKEKGKVKIISFFRFDSFFTVCKFHDVAIESPHRRVCSIHTRVGLNSYPRMGIAHSCCGTKNFPKISNFLNTNSQLRHTSRNSGLTQENKISQKKLKWKTKSKLRIMKRKGKPNMGGLSEVLLF